MLGFCSRCEKDLWQKSPCGIAALKPSVIGYTEVVNVKLLTDIDEDLNLN